MRRSLLNGSLVVLGALLFAGPARAAVVSIDKTDPYFPILLVRDRHAERNDLSVHVWWRRQVVQERGSAPLTAVAPCDKEQAREVVCHVHDPYGAKVLAGDGDDRIRVWMAHQLDAVVRAGAGNDVVELRGHGGTAYGQSGQDILDGSGALDVLDGGTGRDQLYGHRGDDWLDGGVATRRARGSDGADLLSGGHGRDTAAYEERRSPVTVDLSAGHGGAIGEGDVLRSIENAIGGKRDDVLTGTAGANELDGLAGSDTLDGRGGPDALDAGADVSEGQGDLDHAADHLRCGNGVDTVFDATLRDLLPRDCELLDSASYGGVHGLHVQPRAVSPARVLVQAYCDDLDYEGGACSRRVTLNAHGKRLGRSGRVKMKHMLQWISVPLVRPLPQHGVVDVKFDGADAVNDDPAFGRQVSPYRLHYRLVR